MHGHIATSTALSAPGTSSEDNNISESYESFSATPLGDLSPNQLTPEDLEFIARTEISSWHALREPTTTRPFCRDIMMEPPRLHRRKPNGTFDFVEKGPASRYSRESTWTTGRRTMSWSGSSAASMTSLLSTSTNQNQAIVRQHYGHGKRLLDAGPKRPTVSLKAEMPMPSEYFSYSGQGFGTGARSTRSISPRRPPATRYPSQQLIGKKLDNKPGDGLRKLPKELLLVVMRELKEAHLGGEDRTQTCSTCFIRDLCSLARANRQLGIPAQQRLYEHVMLVGQDSSSHVKKRFKIKFGTRLKLLRKTLRANAYLAGLVRTIRVPSFQEAGAHSDDEMRAYEDIVACAIMACPNLEGLEGLITKYDYGFSRITQALSTRTELAEHIWHLDGTANELLTYAHARRARRGKLSEEDTGFLSLHARWQKLNALAIHSSPTPSTLSSHLLDPLFMALPSLQHLALSNVTLPPDFPLFLPPLTSLNLSMSNLTPQNLSDLTRAPIIATLQSLTLDLPPAVLSLPTFARLLSSLKALRRLSLTSPTPLELPLGISIFLHPYLASRSLRYLHWDVTPSTIIKESTDASHILAMAIAADGFPNMRRLRAVRDTGGVLQSVCIPSNGWDGVLTTGVSGVGPNGPKAATRKSVEKEKEKEKKTKSMSRKSADSGSSGSSLRNSLRSGMTGMTLVGSSTSIYGDDTTGDLKERLREAKAAAQARIEIAKLRPRWRLVAEDWTFHQEETPRITAKSEVGGFIGLVGSKVEYYLDYHEGERSVEELIDEGHDNEPKMCDGGWNCKDQSVWGSKGGNSHKRRPIGYKEGGLNGLF